MKFQKYQKTYESVSNSCAEISMKNLIEKCQLNLFLSGFEKIADIFEKPVS